MKLVVAVVRHEKLNDVLIDERQVLYTVDRVIGGLYILDFRV